ncbi:hypothetical protein FNV43_RR10112 [Rhamnella rubrinervis]|uniref:Prolamin-like domain-containing protein n=1 Tax=Rhamnella rubrinervis TaxID=2594499 RepID=A0A8K0HCI6_9ROSA|nr:hypothetical protein FNV43_RR10112 [Rhamnella rubrinervis]
MASLHRYLSLMAVLLMLLTPMLAATTIFEEYQEEEEISPSSDPPATTGVLGKAREGGRLDECIELIGLRDCIMEMGWVDEHGGRLSEECQSHVNYAGEDCYFWIRYNILEASSINFKKPYIL